MRRDIGKVVFERAKSARTWASKTPRLKQVLLDADGEQFDEAPNSIRLKRQKWRNSHFNAVEHFLVCRIGRSWNAVHAEICAATDARSRLGGEIRDYIFRIVATACWFEGPKVMTAGCGVHREVDGLYVHPTTGTLLRTKDPLNLKSMR